MKGIQHKWWHCKHQRQEGWLGPGPQFQSSLQSNSSQWMGFNFCEVSTKSAKGPEPAALSPLEGQPPWLLWLQESVGAAVSIPGCKGCGGHPACLPPITATHCLPPSLCMALYSIRSTQVFAFSK